MWRIALSFKQKVIVLAVVLISVLCYLAFLPYVATHVGPQVNCSSACSPYSQVAVIGSQPLKDKKIEKDPVPPTSWPHVDMNLVLFYLSMILVIPYAVSIARKEVLLTTQMRF